MDAVTLIVTALSAGATVGGVTALQDDIKDAVKAAYTKLRELVQKRFEGDKTAELVLAEHEAHPETWEAPLAAKLTELGAVSDADLLSAARSVLALLGATYAKYNINVYDSKGVQSGDGSSQINIF